MSSQQARLTLRPPPHRHFLQGYPGIPAGPGRPEAHIAGSVEVRLGGKGLKASWLRIELRKIESTATENWGELIGKGPIQVWTAEGSAEQDDEGEWDLLQTADFPFRIAIPEGLPPTIRLEKHAGISYEMVTSLCVKTKKGLIRKDTTSTVIQSTHPIVLEKHELHSTWPIYHIPDDHEQMANDVYARIYRKQTCYGPGDKVEARIILTSKNISPVKIKTVALSIRETITFRGSKRGSRMVGGVTKTANQKTEMLAQKAISVGGKIYKGDTKTYDITLIIPKTHQVMTIQTAKHIEISYTMRVYVDAKQPIIIDHLPLTITTAPSSLSGKVVPQIGQVPGLSYPIDHSDVSYAGEEIRRPQSAGPSVAYHQQPAMPPARPGTSDPYRAPPLRSLSFASSGDASNASTVRGGRGGGADLNRRDTVMTTSTAGPGLAGRGIPGGIFSWGQLGAAQPYAAFGPAQGPVRGAFAGPPSIYEGRELAPEENRALYHHSQNNHLGEVFEGQAVLPEAYVDHATPRISTTPSMSSVPEAVEHHARNVLDSHRRPPPQSTGLGSQSFRTDTPPTLTAAQAAELEKERLYQRAREQAERNQRRAAEAAASSDMTSTDQVPRERPTEIGLAAQRQAANNEKQILYERARRQAEQYQGRYEEGADFPVENLTPNGDMSRSKSDLSIDTTSSHGIGATLGATAMSAFTSRNRNVSPGQHDVPSVASSNTREGVSSNSVYASAEQEKRRLYEAAMAERDLYLNNGGSSRATGSASTVAGSRRSSAQSQSVSVIPTRSGPSSPTVTATFPSAEEEKRRFAAAKAQTDAYLRSSGQQSAVPSSATSSARQSYERGPSAGYMQATAVPAPNPNGGASYPSAEEEKRGLYESAKAQVESHQPWTATQQGTSDSVSAQGSRSNAYADHSNDIPGSSAAAYVQPAVTAAIAAYPSAEVEKRMLYERAKAEVEGHTAQSTTQAHSQALTDTATNGISNGKGGSQVKSQASSVAHGEDEKAQLRRFYEAQDAVTRHQQQNSDGSNAPPLAQSPAISRPEASYASGYRSPIVGHPASSGVPLTSSPGAGLLPNPYDTRDPPAHNSIACSRPAFLDKSCNPSYSGSEVGTSAVVAAEVNSNSIALPNLSLQPPPLSCSSSPGTRFMASGRSGSGSGGGTGVSGASDYRSFSSEYNVAPAPKPASIPTSMSISDSSAASLYAPRIAPANWHEFEEASGSGSGGSAAGGAGAPPPPPIPPKIPLGGDRAS